MNTDLCRFPATAKSLSVTHSLERFSVAAVEITDDDDAGNDVSLHAAAGDDGLAAAAAPVDDLSFCARELMAL